MTALPSPPPILLLHDVDSDHGSVSAPMTAANPADIGTTDQNTSFEMVDWMDSDAFFLADGSKNHKLRDTIRDALKTSKFDSVSALLTANLSFNPKRKPRANLVSAQSRPSTKGVAREIVLGKKADTRFVAVLAPNVHAKRPLLVKTTTTTKAMNRREVYTSGSSLPTQHHHHHLRIRDVVDDGFITKKQQEQHDVSSTSGLSSSPRTTVSTQCFACWSAIKGCLCEEHRDKSQHPRPASQSALMCANWEVDQLRRKYRAEEIQEIFMKAKASLRYDKVRKVYVTVVQCHHPIYRYVESITTILNKTMRRKLHTRAWFRSFLEQLRLGLVKHKSGPSILKARETLRNAKWCDMYSRTVVDFHPVAPVTRQRVQAHRELGVISIPPERPHFLNGILVTECPTPVELYRPRRYDLLPRRCIPMPQPSFLDAIPLPIPNRFLDGQAKIGWIERISARVSTAALYRAMAQVKACTPPRGFDLARRTRITPPTTVLFASFGRKPCSGNLAIGGLSADMLIYMVVTTFIPPQFGNFTVTDRRPLCLKPTLDHSAVYLCVDICPHVWRYVVRPLEHALNTRRPPTIMLCIAQESHERWINRPEQTGEDVDFGFITVMETPGVTEPDETTASTFLPSVEILSYNIPTVHATVTTRADRYYPFCEPTTRESTIVEFIHLLWMGKSSRNQPQVRRSVD